MFIALCTILILLNRPEVRRLSGAEAYIAQERSSLGSFSRGERNTLIAFLVAVALWILPGLTALIFGDESTIYSVLYSRLDEGTVAIIAAALLFLLPINWPERRFTMNWNEASRIDWGTVILFGASFGFMMPVSTPQNAVVYGSGMIPITKMVRSGLAFDIIGLILIVLLIPVMAGLILA
jgi:sodium-dependent dicarboxylate transporter 2/3/5